MNAEWKPGFAGLHNADAQLVAREIIAIGESVTPEQIVNKARNADTELHKCFDWDDTTAAEKYRLHQARQVVCHLVIKETIQKDKPPIRFFFAPENGSGYQPQLRRLQKSFGKRPAGLGGPAGEVPQLDGIGGRL